MTAIATASQEQSIGLDQINRVVAQMEQVVQTAATQTEELMSTAQVLAEQSHQLEELVGRFNLAADRGWPASPRFDMPSESADRAGTRRSLRARSVGLVAPDETSQ